MSSSFCVTALAREAMLIVTAASTTTTEVASPTSSDVEGETEDAEVDADLVSETERVGASEDEEEDDAGDDAGDDDLDLLFSFSAFAPFGRGVFPIAAAARFAASISLSIASRRFAGRNAADPAASPPSTSSTKYARPVKCAWNHRARHCCAVRFESDLAIALQFVPC